MSVVFCRAAVVLQQLLSGNVLAKQRLLTLPLQLAPAAGGTAPDVLLPR